MKESNLVDLIINYTIYGTHFSSKFTVYEKDVNTILNEVILLVDQYHCEELSVNQTATIINENRVDTLDIIKESLTTNLDATRGQKTDLKLTLF